MTNGVGGLHGRKRGKKEAARKTRAKTSRSSPKRKGWIPDALAKAKQD